MFKQKQKRQGEDTAVTLPGRERQILCPLGQTIIISWLEWSWRWLLAAKRLRSSVEALKMK